jgi:hypothetical protein
MRWLKEERRVRAHAKRLGLYEAIRERHSKGEYLTTIAHNLEIDYKTARRYALSDAQAPQEKPRLPSPSRRPSTTRLSLAAGTPSFWSRPSALRCGILRIG